MQVYVFDLDDTLLMSNSYSNYNDISINKYLINIFNEINVINDYPIYIYTNGTYGHAMASLEALNLSNYVNGIFARDTIPYMKPLYNSFSYVDNSIKQEHPNSKIYFFDDLLENLYTSSHFGWYTIYVNKRDNNIGGGDWKPNAWIRNINDINI
tara:strand:+ start:306 stop:767 length:462 start_codon:yes stop_codon:yes gene_type:complete